MMTYYALVDTNGRLKMCDATTTIPPGWYMISWNSEGPTGPTGATGATGPQGPQGDPGSSGYEIITHTYLYPAHTVGNSFVPTAPAGKRIVGVYFTQQRPVGINCLENNPYPDLVGDKWVLIFENQTDSDYSFDAWFVCVNA